MYIHERALRGESCDIFVIISYRRASGTRGMRIASVCRDYLFRKMAQFCLARAMPEQVQYLRGRNLSGEPFIRRVVFIQEHIRSLHKFYNFCYVYNVETALSRYLMLMSDMRLSKISFDDILMPVVAQQSKILQIALADNGRY